MFYLFIRVFLINLLISFSIFLIFFPAASKIFTGSHFYLGVYMPYIINLYEMKKNVTFYITVSHVVSVLLTRLLNVHLRLHFNVSLSAWPSFPRHCHMYPCLSMTNATVPKELQYFIHSGGPWKTPDLHDEALILVITTTVRHFFFLLAATETKKLCHSTRSRQKTT